ncbi:MAG: ABC transporter permease [Acidobacteriota bacterium]|nr:ABC transporter permease [Acidobacteriota bacterium]
MSSRPPSRSDKFYAALLRFFPFDFRGDFGSEMEQTFREQRAQAERDGRIGLLRLWWETITGIFTTAPREHLSMLNQDIHYALRTMRKNLGFTMVAVLTLALGIGANTAIVSVIDAVLVRPLPYQQGDQLVVLHQRAEKSGTADMSFSVKEINDYRRQNGSLSGVEEYHSMQFTLLSKDEATRVRAGVVSSGFFGMFGVRPILGRDFTSADDLPGAPAVLLLSYEYWKQHEGGDPRIVGKTFEMNDRVHTVIGVLPQVPQYPNENDVYMPTTACPARSGKRMIENRDARMMNVFGRMKPNVSMDRTKADLALIASRLEHDYPASYTSAMGYTASTESLREELTHGARPLLLLLLGAAACVLLIACANVANLTLSRMSGRERELVVRSALGAGKGRLLRQLMTESLILSLLAAGLGVLFASQSLKLLVDFSARLTPRAREIQVDSSMLLFALAVAFLTSMVFGSMSALYSRGDLASGLKEGSAHSSLGLRRRRARNVLIVCQVAFSFVLLIGAGLMLRSFSRLQRVDPGFVPQRVLALEIDLNWSKYGEPAQFRDVARRLLDKVRSQPDVLSAAVSSNFPLNPETMHEQWTRRFTVEGRPMRDSEARPRAGIRIASADYFKTLGIPLVRGRVFEDSDNEKSPGAVVVNRSLARRYWGQEDAIGKRITFDQGDHWLTIVGIVGDVKEFALNKDPGDELYLASNQEPMIGSILVRTDRDALALSNQVRRAILEVDSQTAIPHIQTLEEARHEVLASPRVMTDLLGLFAGLALLIAATGIGGILALTVNQRMNEIGIRVALGARPGNVFGMIVRQGMGMVVIGLAIGLVSALGLTRLMKGLLFETTPTDPATFVGVSVVLALTALLACYLPARRALRVDPLTALRSE